MSTASNDNQEDPLVVIARAVRTRGLKGEIVADLLTDFPERFENVGSLFAVSPQGERRQVKVESYWFQKDRVVFKLAGYDSVESAKELVDYEFAVLESERVSLPDNHYYDWELEGCSVSTVGETRLGRVTRVMRTGGVELLVVEDEQGRDYLLPMADSIIIKIDPDEKTILVDPPEGLLDL
jgi:16S rRNA processing protein RimM